MQYHPQTVLVTGGTGFIGRHLVERLLGRKHTVYLMVRATRREANQQRIDQLLTVAHERGGTLHVVTGDVAIDGLALGDEAGDMPALDHVFHLAALYDLAAPADRFEAVNVDGTRNLLAHLRHVGFSGVLHHVSSIAVAGDHEGRFREADLDVGQSHPHPYHRTKFRSEQLVRESNVRYRIYRPGAVVGHSQTGEMDKADGPYFAFPILLALRDNVPRFVRIPIPARGRLPIVPVDFVADAMDHLAHRADLDGRTFHLVDPQAPSTVEALNIFADAAGAPRFSRMSTRWTKILPGPVKQMFGALGSVRFVRDELLRSVDVPPQVVELADQSATFDSANVDAALAGSGVDCPRPRSYFYRLWDYWLREMNVQRDPRVIVDRYLRGRRVLVTGASSGVGAALAKACGDFGAEVILVARREAALETVAEDIRGQGGAAYCYPADLTERESVEALVDCVLSERGPVDVLINNAGKSIRRPLSESLARFHDLERLMAINYFGPARLIAGFLPSMREQRFGHVVNVLTAGARAPAPRFGGYTASKIALAQLGDTLAAELADEHIRNTSVFLGWVRTPMMDATGAFEDTPAMTPAKAAMWILRAVASGRTHAVSPSAKARHLANLLAPNLVGLLSNVVFRIYGDDPDAYPELKLDRNMAKFLVKGRPI